MSTFHERKALRTAEFMKRFKRKKVRCVACGGTGYYDSFNSPPCAACEGTGKCFPYTPSAKSL